MFVILLLKNVILITLIYLNFCHLLFLRIYFLSSLSLNVFSFFSFSECVFFLFLGTCLLSFSPNMFSFTSFFSFQKKFFHIFFVHLFLYSLFCLGEFHQFNFAIKLGFLLIDSKKGGEWIPADILWKDHETITAFEISLIFCVLSWKPFLGYISGNHL